MQQQAQYLTNLRSSRRSTPIFLRQAIKFLVLDISMQQRDKGLLVDNIENEMSFYVNYFRDPMFFFYSLAI